MRCSFLSTQTDLPELAIEPPANLGWPMVAGRGRWSWSLGDVAVWDNRCTMHYALRDFGDDYREIHRMTLKGERPR